MPITIRLLFPGGRYNATPWGRHVNEGVAEWPPSPWRLLRALVAVWRRTCPTLSEEQVRRVLTPLTQPPRFQLPPHRVAHTRHYMPLGKKSPKEMTGGGTTLVFDTFVSVGHRSPLYIGWQDGELSAEDRAVLAQLLGNLTSLGRAEGWVQAELWNEAVVLPVGPADDGDANPVPVFCPDPNTVFGDEHYPTLDPKKLARGKINPADFLFDCPRWHLCLDTETIHDRKWPTVPGTRWINYTRPTEIRSAPRRMTSASPKPMPTVARFLLDGPVLPRINHTVRLAEAFRHEALSAFTGLPGRSRYSSILSGKDEQGQPLRTHGHAHFLPTAEGDDPRRITHLTVYASDKLGEKEVAALARVSELKLPVGGDQVLRLQVQLIGLGARDLFDNKVEIFAQAHVWDSATPFVAHRHLKRRGTKRDTIHLVGDDPRLEFLALALRELIERREVGLLTDVTLCDTLVCGLRGVEIHRGRDREGDDGYRRPCGAFRLTFQEPINGPLSLGYGCHYGLGLFLPVQE